MKVDPFAQLSLLDLQAVDTALQQLAHRRRNLPELAELNRLDAELARMGDERSHAQMDVDDLERDIRRMDGDVEQVKQRAQRNQTRLDSGQGSGKELEALQHELVTLRKRQSDLEDSELALMERKEAAQATLAETVNQLVTVTEKRDAALARRDAALAEIAAEEEKRRADRGPIAVKIPEALLALYEKIRADQGGMGAAMLRARRCEGCRIEMAGRDLDVIRKTPMDEVLRCENCRRILIRTSESGL